MLGFTVVWGTRLYGKVDEVPGLCYVATRFFHLWYVPLVPLNTYAVVAEDFEGWRGPEISMSSKSVMVGYCRGLAAAAAVAGAVMFCFGMGPEEHLLGPACALLTCAALLFLATRSKAVSRASYERACELGRALEVTKEGQAIIDLAYGKIDEAQKRSITEQEDSIADGNFEPSDEQPLEPEDREAKRKKDEAKKEPPKAEAKKKDEAKKEEPKKDEPRRPDVAKPAPGQTRKDVIKFRCPHCKETARVPSSLAGKQGKCKKCRKVIEVPTPVGMSGRRPAATG